MPALETSAGQRILVTGANGFVALWVVRVLLEQGFTVRGTVRSENKGRHLDELFGSYGDKFEWVVVEDIVKEGAFDEAVKGVHAIEHTAAPISSTSDDPDEYLKPSVEGTLSILRSALKFGTDVKRVVVTSSLAAVMRTVTEPPVIFDEDDWADEFVDTLKREGRKASEQVKYFASKTLAERAVFTFYDAHKSQINWDVATVLPPVVLGPTLQDVKKSSDLTGSPNLWYQKVVKDQDDDPLNTTPFYPYVDVRDLAAAHVNALTKEAAGGKRLLICAGSIGWQDTRDIVYSLRPDLYESGVLPRGKHDSKTSILWDYNGEKAKSILGLEYRDIKHIALDMITDFERRGWLSRDSV
ncbi:NAD-P-binding protein [Agrocybe pediades]|nr:NAD-P-binding protein [Agrocybe pediades]